MISEHPHPFTTRWSPGRSASCSSPPRTATALSRVWLPPAHPEAGWIRDDDLPVLAAARRQLGEYFAGERTDFDLPLAARRDRVSAQGLGRAVPHRVRHHPQLRPDRRRDRRPGRSASRRRGQPRQPARHRRPVPSGRRRERLAGRIRRRSRPEARPARTRNDRAPPASRSELAGRGTQRGGTPEPDGGEIEDATRAVGTEGARQAGHRAVPAAQPAPGRFLGAQDELDGVREVHGDHRERAQRRHRVDGHPRIGAGDGRDQPLLDEHGRGVHRDAERAAAEDRRGRRRIRWAGRRPRRRRPRPHGRRRSSPPGSRRPGWRARRARAGRARAVPWRQAARALRRRPRAARAGRW